MESEDRQKRSTNIIIHGVTERENDEKTNIQKWVADIVTDLHASVTVKSVSRIGKLTETSNRLILVNLGSEEEKFIFIGNLSALKGIQKYVGISVTEDLTSDDRKAYKQLSVEAASRNKSDPGYVWRVRGSSKNGHYIKKFKIQK